MKTQSAIIKAVMLSRANANGDYPIAIRVNYKGRVMKSLPIALPKNKWNEEKGVVVKTYPNAAMMNKIINDEIQKVRGRELDLQAKGEVYSAKDLIEIKIENETKERVSTSIKDIIDSLVKERGLSRNNQARYATGYKALKLYFNSEDPDIRLITSDSMQGFCKWCTNVKKIKDGTINTHIKVISSTYKYAIDKGIVPESSFPFRKFKPWKTYKEKCEPLALTKLQFDVLESYYANHWTPVIGETVGVVLKDQNDKDRILKLNNPLSALCLYLNSFYMQGLALCDLAELKVDQFTLKSGTRTEKRMEPIPVTRNGQTVTAYLPIEEEVQFSYYEVKDVQRLKTREKVPLVIELTYTTSSLLHYYMATAKDRGGYLFPIYNGDMTEEQRFKRYKMVQTIIGKKLKEVAKAVNQYAIENNVENWVDIPSTFNFYSARHTFASIMAASGVSNINIATMMGRSVDGLSNYLHSITSIDQLLQAKQGKGI